MKKTIYSIFLFVLFAIIVQIPYPVCAQSLPTVSKPKLTKQTLQAPEMIFQVPLTIAFGDNFNNQNFINQSDLEQLENINDMQNLVMDVRFDVSGSLLSEQAAMIQGIMAELSTFLAYALNGIDMEQYRELDSSTGVLTITNQYGYEEGNSLSGDRYTFWQNWMSNESMGSEQSGDRDIDDDGVPNGQDGDMDGDDIPNEEDDDQDGDGTPNDKDCCDKNPNKNLIPETEGRMPFSVTEFMDQLLEHLSSTIGSNDFMLVTDLLGNDIITESVAIDRYNGVLQKLSTNIVVSDVTIRVNLSIH